MSQEKLIQFRTILFGFIATVSAANAATISVVPSTLATGLHSYINVVLTISGLGAGVAPSVGAWDLELHFDGAVVPFQGGSWGTNLDLFNTGDLRDVSYGSDFVRLSEVSLNSIDDLNQFQPPDFALATVQLFSLAQGVSPLTIKVNHLADASGVDLAVNLVNSQVTVVPEPEAWWLIATGLILVHRLRRASYNRAAFR